MHKYGESKMTRIMMATVRHVAALEGRTKYQAVWFLLNRVYKVVRQEHHCCQLQQGPQMVFTQIAFTLGSMQVSNEHLEQDK